MHALACNFAEYLAILILLTVAKFAKKLNLFNVTIDIPPHLKYVATLPCNLSLIACFLELMLATQYGIFH